MVRCVEFSEIIYHLLIDGDVAVNTIEKMVKMTPSHFLLPQRDNWGI